MEQIGLAVIGTGLMGSLYTRIASQIAGVKVIALCDLLADRVEPLAREVRAMAYVGETYRQMLEEHPQIDAVLVCTPEDAHVDPALAVLEAGKHILVEKPLAMTVEDAERIVKGAGQKDVTNMMGYILRFDPRYYAMKQAIADGEIGDIIYIHARRNSLLAHLQRLRGRVQTPFLGGVHEVDMMRWVTSSPVSRVFATKSEKSIGAWDVSPAFLALLTFENGVIAALENAWVASPVSGRPQRTSFTVWGTKGLIEVRSHEQGLMIYREAGTAAPDTVYMPTSYGQITGASRDQIAYFIRCVREREASDSPLEDGLKEVMVVEAIMRSADQRTEIVLPS